MANTETVVAVGGFDVIDLNVVVALVAFSVFAAAAFAGSSAAAFAASVISLGVFGRGRVTVGVDNLTLAGAFAVSAVLLAVFFWTSQVWRKTG